MSGPKDRLRARLRANPLWAPYQRFRHRRRLLATLEPGHDKALHQVLVGRQQERERAAMSEADRGAGTTPSELEAFFGRFHVVDPGIPLVRIGPEGDGGYLLPDDLDGVEACLSPGVADEIGFDIELADRGMRVHMIDRSVDGLPQEHESIDFEPLFLGATTEPGWTTLTDWVERREPGTSDLMLEMDIEGAEWAVLLTTEPATLRRFRVLVLELHDLQLLTKRSSLLVMQSVLDKLLADFALVHVHQNNYEYPVPYQGFELHPVVEATFVRKDRLRDPRPRAELRHPLDSANAGDLPDYPLDPRWL